VTLNKKGNDLYWKSRLYLLGQLQILNEILLPSRKLKDRLQNTQRKTEDRQRENGETRVST
jgi:hypothetical protein